MPYDLIFKEVANTSSTLQRNYDNHYPLWVWFICSFVLFVVLCYILLSIKINDLFISLLSY